jgi:hypothetical protein
MSQISPCVMFMRIRSVKDGRSRCTWSAGDPEHGKTVPDGAPRPIGVHRRRDEDEILETQWFAGVELKTLGYVPPIVTGSL